MASSDENPNLQPVPTSANKWLVAALAVVVATLVRLLLDAWFEDRILFVTYFAAIAFAAWYGGVWLGAATALASYLAADYFFVAPRTRSPSSNGIDNRSTP